jgi:hypothetical protein
MNKGVHMIYGEFFQMAFMPYAPIKQGFQIGNYSIWPYYKESNSRINDITVINKLNHYFSRYCEWKYDKQKGGYDKPIDEIYIISPNEYKIGIERLSKDQKEDIFYICYILAFCAICETKITANSDAFRLYIQNFKLDSEGVALYNKNYTQYDMVKFMKPYNLDVVLLKYNKTHLCDVLGNILKHKNNRKIKRIFRALELFFRTASTDEVITNEHRLLTLVMCFEILLNFKDKYRFSKKIQNVLDIYEPELETRIIRTYKNEEEKLTFSKTGWWLIDLYNLRSDIIHGNEANWEEKKYGDIFSRIEFGGILLRKLIKNILRKDSLYETAMYDLLFEANDLDNQLEDIIKKYNKLFILDDDVKE